MKFFTTKQLGRRQSLTPEGFLACEAVAIARTGTMTYGPDDGTGLEVGADGVVRVARADEDVFRDETIASFAGKPVTNDHPEGDVTPETWKALTVGVVMNPRRGVGAEDDLLLADLLITDPEAIKAVRSGKREVSCGYDADYEQTGPGTGRQINIVGNHVALVESGRCGPRCSIQDSASEPPSTKMEHPMARSLMDRFTDRVRRAFRDGDENELENALKAVPQDGPEGGDNESDQHIHIHLPGDKKEDAPVEAPAVKTEDEPEDRVSVLEKQHAEILARLDAIEAKLTTTEDGESVDPEDAEIEAQLAEEAPTGTHDSARKARDSAYLADSWQDSVALAEILVPGIRVPTFDKAADPKATFKKLCGFRRTALDLAYAKPDTRAIIDDLHGKALDAKSMTCDAVRGLFRGAAAVKKQANGKQTLNIAPFGGGMGVKGSLQSPADLNKRMREFYGDSK